MTAQAPPRSRPYLRAALMWAAFSGTAYVAFGLAEWVTCLRFGGGYDLALFGSIMFLAGVIAASLVAAIEGPRK